MTVYATQMHLTMGKEGLRPKFPSLLPGHAVHAELTERYGELVWLLDAEDSPWTAGVIDKLREGLIRFDPANDYLLCLGNPVLLSLMTVVASEDSDSLRFLQWRSFYRNIEGNRERYEREGEYKPLHVTL